MHCRIPIEVYIKNNIFYDTVLLVRYNFIGLFGQTCYLHLKMEAICFSDNYYISVNIHVVTFQRTIFFSEALECSCPICRSCFRHVVLALLSDLYSVRFDLLLGHSMSCLLLANDSSSFSSTSRAITGNGMTSL